jgi:hypothetical protein
MAFPFAVGPRVRIRLPPAVSPANFRIAPPARPDLVARLVLIPWALALILVEQIQRPLGGVSALAQFPGIALVSEICAVFVLLCVHL